MGVSVSVLASGSRGNCALVATSSTRILVDAGLSGRETYKRLRALGERAEEIDVARAQKNLEHAQKLLEEPHVDLDPAAALAEMRSAQARLEAAARAPQDSRGVQ